MQFIRNAFKERKNTRMLEIMFQLAESLEVPTIAEGVETAEQMLTLKTMGCDLVQGYYFSRPLPAQEFEQFILEKKAIESGERSKDDRLSSHALHDPLTGLYNQNAFQILFQNADQHRIGVLIASVDGFAAIKEEKGSEYGDRVICRVADVLRDNFRSADNICRLREDEFVIIMTRMTGRMHRLVVDKVDQVNEILSREEDGVMPLSLSVGVAFSDRQSPQGDIFEDAYTALRRMKQSQDHGCALF
jgi:diguanylate cyclase (GGDEF)-like protein